MPAVIVDSRERNTELISALEESGLSVSIVPLPVGDYLISDRVCIERKTTSDFESSLMNTRLFDQAERLKAHYRSPIIIVEGGREGFRLGGNVITGAVAHLYIDVGVQVIFSDSASDTARIISALAKHEQKAEKRKPSPKGGARAYTDSQYQEYIVGNLPGVGAKIASSLLAHFGSIERITCASVKELMQVDKVGKKKAERIHGVLHADYKLETEP